MRSSIVLTALGAVLAIASPVAQQEVQEFADGIAIAGPLDKRGLNEIEARAVVTHYRTVTVWVTPKPAAAPKTVSSNKPHVVTHTSWVFVTVGASAPAQDTTAKVTTTAKATTTAAAAGAAKASPANPNAAVPSGTDWKSIVLYHHNVHRLNHSAAALTYDSTMESYAFTVANSCKYGHDLTPGGGGYGQNIAAFGTTNNAAGIGANNIVANSITELWYNNELPIFLPSYYGQANVDTNFEQWGHFSQIVWVATKSVGCYSKLCAANTAPFSTPMPWWFTVCNYSPPGNMGGQYGNNIKKPLGNPTVHANW